VFGKRPTETAAPARGPGCGIVSTIAIFRQLRWLGQLRDARRIQDIGWPSCAEALYPLNPGARIAAEMDLARTFVSFSSADIQRYHMMCAWKAHEHINFNFADFQLDEAINSKTPYYIKSVCAAKIRRTDTFALLIGNDTHTKTVFVKDEVEVAIEKGCRLIGVNLNNSRCKDGLCPSFFGDKGALFVPFSARILSEALKWNKGTPTPGTPDDWIYRDSVYTNLGYTLVGSTAILPPPPNPFAGGNRPPWAK
jgi:hypothetical protein